MKKSLSWFKKIPLKYAIPVVVVLLLGWFFFFRDTSKAQELMMVNPTDFKATVSVAGTVTPAQDVDLGFTQSGRVTGVYAKVGQRVGVGTTLAVVENGDLRANVLQQQAALEQEQAQLAALQTGTRPEEVAVKQAAVASAQVGLVDALQDAYRSGDAAVHNTIDQFMSNTRTQSPTLSFSTTDSNFKTAVENKRVAAEATLTSWAAEIHGLSAQQDLTVEVTHAQNNLSATVSLLSDCNGALNRAIVTTQTPQSTIDTYIAAVASARSTVNASVSSVNGASATLSAAQKNLTLSQAGSTSADLQAQEAKVKAAEASLAQAQAQLQKTYITAPFSGVVSRVDAKVGQIVSPNTPEISLISSGVFQIESYVPEVAIASLQVGNSATVYLDAYGESVPFAAGVVSIDPASEERDGVATYKVTLQFSKQDERIRSGMTANMVITTQEKAGSLVVPQGALVDKNGAHFLLVKVGNKTQERPVELGLSSLGQVEVTAGLQAGETIVLNP